MKLQADRHRTDRAINIGDWVWFKLQPYRQTTAQMRCNQKLAKKYFGPFKSKATSGKVSYKLQLPHEARIHNVFHVLS